MSALRDRPWAVIIAIVSIAALIVDIVFGRPETGAVAAAAMLAVLAALANAAYRGRAAQTLLGRLVRVEIALLVAALGFLAARAFLVLGAFTDGAQPGGVEAGRTYDVVFALLAGGAALMLYRPEAIGRVAVRMANRPALLLTASFAAMIAVGTLLLTLPVAVRRVADVSVVDSLFTMTSAVCVTGLAVNDIGTTYTIFGQIVILGGIQLGGIGIMTIAALALTMTRERALSDEAQYARMMESRTLRDLKSTVRSVVVATLIIEALGTILLALMLQGDARLGGRSPIWVALFHAVSAFCNAGFALFPSNLTPFQRDAGMQAVIMILIVLGGIGFPVMRELYQRAKLAVRRLAGGPAPKRRLSAGARVVLLVTAFLIVLGAALVSVLESNGVLEPLDAGDRIWNAVFTSVTARTAGFNTVDFGAMRAGTLLFVIVLMFIGGSPASCAGGIKTTTAAVVFAALRGELRGREPHLAGRALSPEALRRATAVLTMSTLIVFAFLLLLTLTETKKTFLQLAFETVSAFGTVGLSTGITPTLSVAGKLIISTLMFVGRVGPLTIALAVGRPAAKERYRLAREDVPIG